LTDRHTHKSVSTIAMCIKHNGNRQN